MGIDHRSLYVRVAEQFLNGPDVITVLKQVGRERVPQRMTARRFGDPGFQDGRYTIK